MQRSSSETPVTTLGGHAAESDGHHGGHEATGKRAQAAVLAAEDLQCPICVEQLQDAFVTSCGHTFCFACIRTHLSHRRNCPCCASYLTTEHIYPNFLLNKILSKAASGSGAPNGNSLQREVEQALEARRGYVRPQDIEGAIQLLTSRKDQIAAHEEASSLHLLMLLLQDVRKRTVANKAQLSSLLQSVEHDMRTLASRLEREPPSLLPGLASTNTSAATTLQNTSAPNGSAAAPVASLPDSAPVLQVPLAGAESTEGSQAAVIAAACAPADVQPPEVSTSLPTTDAAGEAAARMVAPVPRRPAVPGSGNGTAGRGGGSTSVLGPRPASVALDENGPGGPAYRQLATLRAAKKRLMLVQYDDLQQCYLGVRAGAGAGAGNIAGGPKDPEGSAPAQASRLGPAGGTRGEGGSNALTAGVREAALDQFTQVLSAATSFSRMRVAAEVPRAAVGGPAGPGAAPTSAPPRASTSHLVSSLDFDTTARLLATCSAHRLFLWDYPAMLGQQPDQQGAKCQLTTRSKLTGLAFSRQQQALLAATDSEGTVWLHDTTTQQMVMDIAAHDGRIWALDFAPAGAGVPGQGGSLDGSQGGAAGAAADCFASGSDDYTVRVWDTRSARSCSTIDTRANVCSVRYCPWDANYMAVGSAAHAVLLYDLRRAGGTAAPLASLAGHRKAVSYVRWASRSELVSASTDSSLRLWDASGWQQGPAAVPVASGASPCVRMFTGHVNERNFVGLSVHDDLIATGSEAHEVVLYYKHMPSPGIRHRFDPGNTANDAAGRGGVAPQHFTSALTWHPSGDHLVAATSQGSLWVLALQQDMA